MFPTKCPPSIEGVVINKQLFARAKRQDSESSGKDMLDKLEDEHRLF